MYDGDKGQGDKAVVCIRVFVRPGLGCDIAENITDGNRLDMCLKHMTFVGKADIHKSW